MAIMNLKAAFSPDRFLADKVAHAKRPLNYGCGNRKFANEVGVDLSPETDADFIITKGQPLPFEDDEFDLIVSRFVFEHVDDLASVIGECSRILQPGGQLIFVVPHCFSQDAFDDPTHCNFFTLRTGDYLIGAAHVHYAQGPFDNITPHLRISLVYPEWRIIRWPINAGLSTLSALFPRLAEQLIKLPFIGGTIVFVCKNR